MERLNILVLHALGDPLLIPAFLHQHVFVLKNNFPEHNYLYHDANLALPSYVSEQYFDAIILDVSFLTVRWAGSELFAKRKNDYSFVKDAAAIKIALPQDEYDCSELLDEWMCDWNIDIVYSVISSNWEILYPKYHKKGNIRLGYTGYIDETLIDRIPKFFSARTIDIGYRTRQLPAYFGKIGQVKWTIGNEVKFLAKHAGLKVDIEVGEAASIFGNKWYDFIENSKFTLGSNSGSSLLDPRGDIQKAVRAYMRLHPEALFEEVEDACFPGLDCKYIFTAISPRILEASLLYSGQILVDGSYSNIIKPNEHYIPIRPDGSNFSDVLLAISDTSSTHRMIKRCRDAILSVDELRSRNHAKTMLELISNLSAKKSVSSNPDKLKTVISRYEHEMRPKFIAFWLKKRLIRRAVNISKMNPTLYYTLKIAAKKIRLDRII